ncbi:MAG: NADH-quinone oxidoreductase subunit N [Phycisphaerae bacterium]|nr:NADH-quinone oxidoreductase subunit N [Phycisphaerae bacterium]
MSEVISVSALWPEIILLIAGCAVLLLGQARSEAWRRLMPWLTLAALAAAICIVVLKRHFGEFAFEEGNGLSYGSLAVFVRIAALGLGIPLTLVNWSQSREHERGEFLSMMLMSLAGLLLVGPADNLLMLFLALELVSIPTYIMVILSRTNVRSLEAGTKYFYLGAFSAAIMAYGFSFLYGLSGTASLSGTIEAVQAALLEPGTLEYGLAMIGILLSLGGLFFKIAAVPLHFYIADVYQGAASPVAGFLGFVPKLAGMIAIFKIVLLTGYWDGGHEGTFWLLWIVAVASMTIGNVLALRQANIKRMLAYSGIAHAGYMLVGVIAGPLAGKAVDSGGVGIMGDGTAAVLYYIMIYGIANLGAFAVLGLLRVRGGACETRRDVAGLIRREPGLALLLALALFTLMGLPPTPGFWGKLSLFGSALAAAQLWDDPRLIVLVVIAVLNSALAAAYYLRVIAAALVYENKYPAEAAPRNAEHIGAQLCGFLLLIFAFYPTSLMVQGQDGTQELTEGIYSVSAEPDADGSDIPEKVVAGGNSGRMIPADMDQVVSPLSDNNVTDQ